MELKKEQPCRSDKVINRILKHEFGRDVPRSTLYRHLQREGATRRKLGDRHRKGPLPLDPRPERTPCGSAISSTGRW